MLMAHVEYGFNHIPDGIAEEAIKEGWFAVVDLAEAKARLRGEVDIEPEPEEPKPKRKYTKKVK
jgi:hypothetical protein